MLEELLHAVSSNNLAHVDALLTPTRYTLPMRSNLSVLLSALSNNNHDMLLKLLERKANVNASDFMGDTPLHYAARWGSDCRLVATLIEHAANVNAVNVSQATALHLTASKLGDTKSDNAAAIATLLLCNRANVNAGDLCNESPLHHAAYCSNESIAMLLIDHRADMNMRNVHCHLWSTPLPCCVVALPIRTVGAGARRQHSNVVRSKPHDASGYGSSIPQYACSTLTRTLYL
jgi:ankyrin repeat protein